MLPLKWQLIAIPVTLLYANIFEWLFHKYILHGLGRKKNSFWSFHWQEHHVEARKNGFLDPHYKRSLWSWNSKSKEALALTVHVVILFPIVFYAPIIYLTVIYASLRYYFTHKKSHLDPEWAKRKLPWHYDHHMGKNQHANWGVTRPWFDWVMGTREKMENRP